MSNGHLRWQCRRGMKELDALLVGYLDTRYADASPDEKAAFEALLGLSDPELIGYLLRGERPPDPSQQSVIDRLLGRTPS